MNTGKSTHILLGKLLLRKQPEIARTLLKELADLERPKETSLENIALYYQSLGFPEKRVFVAYILQLYAPYSFSLTEYPLPRGLNKEIANTLKVTPSFVTRLIEQSISDYNIYDGFKGEVANLFQKEAA